MPIPAPLRRLPGDLTAWQAPTPNRRSLVALAGFRRGSQTTPVACPGCWMPCDVCMKPT